MTSREGKIQREIVLATHRDLEAKLAALRRSLPRELEAKYSNLFDEFIQQHEFELALHTVCDYLLEPTTQPHADDILEQIQNLHAAMKIEDNCLADLREKAGG